MNSSQKVEVLCVYRKAIQLPIAETVARVMRPNTSIDFEPHRPSLADNLETEIDDPEFVENIKKLMVKCWAENPLDRPDFQGIRKIVHSMNRFMFSLYYNLQ